MADRHRMKDLPRRAVPTSAAAVLLIAGAACSATAVQRDGATSGSGGPPPSSGHPVAARAIVEASVSPAGVSWMSVRGGATYFSADSGQSWRPLRPPKPPAPGNSIAVAGHQIVVVALSGLVMAVQRSADDGATWQERSVRLTVPAASVSVSVTPDGREHAVAAAVAGSAGAAGGYAQLFVGPSTGTLDPRSAPGGPDVAWAGHRLLMPGGPLRSRLYVSNDQGNTWAPEPVGGPVAPTHDVSPDAAVFGQPVSTNDGTVLPVTKQVGGAVQVVLYRTVDGSRFDVAARLSMSGEVGPGVGAVVSPYGTNGVVVADPSSTTLHALAGGTQKRLPGRGLPGPVDALSFQSDTTGLAQTSVRACAQGKNDCIDELRMYQTTDGGATWARATP